MVGGIDWEPPETPVMRWLRDTGKMVDRASGRQNLLHRQRLAAARGGCSPWAGFDERFQGYGWEDADLGLRLADHGVRVERRPELRVLHAHRYTLRDSLERERAIGSGANLLRRLHEHRAEPPRGTRRGRLKLATGRALAPLLRLPLPERLPPRLFQAAHLAAFAVGHAAEPLPDDPALRGWVADRPVEQAGGERDRAVPRGRGRRCACRRSARRPAAPGGRRADRGRQHAGWRCAWRARGGQDRRPRRICGHCFRWAGAAGDRHR